MGPAASCVSLITSERQLPTEHTDRRARAAYGQLADQVYGEIRHRITRCVLPPGTHLVESQLAEQVGAGRTPVREALQRLLHEGLVRAVDGPRTKLVVAPLTAEDVREAYRMVADLESLSVGAIARSSGVRRRPVATDLGRRHAAFSRAAISRHLDFEALFEAHRGFHAIIVERGAGERVRRAHAVLRPTIERYEWIYGPLLAGRLDSSVREHAAILSAVRAGDPEDAERAIRQNWRAAAERLATEMLKVTGRSGFIMPGPQPSAGHSLG